MPNPNKKQKARRNRHGQSNLTAEISVVSRGLRQTAKPAKPATPAEVERLRARYHRVRTRLVREVANLDALAKVAQIPAPAAGAAEPASATGATEGVAFDIAAADFAGPAPSDRKEIGPAFSTFLSQVGEAMVTAQQQLDEESRKYLTGTVPAAMPAMFRLPRLNAKVQFDFTEGTDSGLNFVFYQKKSSTQETRQHMLDFEIVAAPPPPGFNPPIPGWRLLTGSERAAALAAMNFGSSERLLLWKLPVPGDTSALLLVESPDRKSV